VEDEVLNDDPLKLQAKMRSIKKRVEESSLPLEKIVESIVAKYDKDLTAFIDRMKGLLSRRDILSEQDLEDAILKIPVFMYFASNGLESLGIEGDTAKAVKMEVFNKAFAEIEGTIQDKTRHAELQTFPEYLVDVAYQRAYKKLKTKLDNAEHVFSGMKKVLSKRMLEMELTSRDSGTPNPRLGGRNRERD
jgi:hypothetical protein